MGLFFIGEFLFTEASLIGISSGTVSDTCRISGEMARITKLIFMTISKKRDADEISTRPVQDGRRNRMRRREKLPGNGLPAYIYKEV